MTRLPLLLCALALLSACPTFPEDGLYACEGDADCREGERCVERACVSPGAGCEAPDGCPLLPERCGNGADDDGDGLFDCGDSDCGGFAPCTATEVCNDDRDNDFDGFADCADRDCEADTTNCANGLELCWNGGDDNSNELSDCEDPACVPMEACVGARERCAGGGDDDGDGLADCEDPDCFFAADCGADGDETRCGDGEDGPDGDDLVDCDDADCRQVPSICNGGQLCEVGAGDNDGDGLLPCADPECAELLSASCAGEQDCRDGRDDDGANGTDCEDPACTGVANCRANRGEECPNGIDDDGDGAIDCADPSCRNVTDCPVQAEDCGNGVDDDRDGRIDCFDDDSCSSEPGCQPVSCGDWLAMVSPAGERLEAVYPAAAIRPTGPGAWRGNAGDAPVYDRACFNGQQRGQILAFVPPATGRYSLDVVGSDDATSFALVRDFGDAGCSDVPAVDQNPNEATPMSCYWVHGWAGGAFAHFGLYGGSTYLVFVITESGDSDGQLQLNVHGPL